MLILLLNHMVNFVSLLLFPILIHSFYLGLYILLLFSGDLFFFGRVARRPLATTVDGGVLSRLLTPTQASLARSKSAAALSAEGTDAPGNLRLGDPEREESWPGTDLVTLSFHQ